MMNFFQSVSSALGELWCRAMHADAMWPVKGEYRCRTCLRTYKVAWEHGIQAQPVESGKTVNIASAAAKRISHAGARVA